MSCAASPSSLSSSASDSAAFSGVFAFSLPLALPCRSAGSTGGASLSSSICGASSSLVASRVRLDLVTLSSFLAGFLVSSLFL